MATAKKQTHETVKGEKITTPRGRLSYPHLFKKAIDSETGEETKYEVTFLMPKSTDLSKLIAALEAVGRKAFPGKYKTFAEAEFKAIQDGDLSDVPEEKGNWVIKPRSGYRPGIVMNDMRTIEQYMADEGITDNADVIYGGCYARLSLVPGSFLVKGNSGVTFYLQNVQWLGHGERFGGGGRNPKDDFEAFEEKATSGGFDDNVNENF